MSKRLKEAALHIAKQERGHRMGNFRPIPYAGAGLIAVAFCRTCQASIIYRSRPVGYAPTTEGSAMTMDCIGKSRKEKA